MAAASEYKFLEAVDDELKCLICLRVATDPLQHEECGKLFCKDCLEKHGKKKPCPNCRQENSQYFVDKRGKRAIEALRVKCHVDRQCPWEGTVGTVEAHVATCEFTLVPCPNQCMNDKAKINQYMKKELDQHLKYHCLDRQYKCQYCGREDTYAAINFNHYLSCSKKPIPCPNEECKATIECGLVGDHVERECDYTVVPCKFRSFGCNVERRRRDMAAHEHDDKQRHLDMAIDATLEMMEDNVEVKKLKIDNEELKNENKRLTSKVTKLASAVNMLQRSLGNIGVFVLKDYENVRRECFPPFYLNPKGYRVSLSVNTGGDGGGRGTHISVFMAIVKGDFDADLEWPILGEVTFTLLNQLEDDNHYTRSITLTVKEDAGVNNTNWGLHKFIPHTALDFAPDDNTQYLKDDTLYFKMEFNSHTSFSLLS